MNPDLSRQRKSKNQSLATSHNFFPSFSLSIFFFFYFSIQFNVFIFSISALFYIFHAMIRCKIYTREEQTFKFIKSKKKNFVFFHQCLFNFHTIIVVAKKVNYGRPKQKAQKLLMMMMIVDDDRWPQIKAKEGKAR